MKFNELKMNLQLTGCSYRWNYPVIKYDRGQVRTCCQVYNNHQITEEMIQQNGIDVFLNYNHVQERRMEMLEGIRHQECSPCWNLESSNVPSMRSRGELLSVFLNDELNVLKNKEDVTKEELSNLTISRKPRILEIQLDNVCDLACIYCNADYSTTWAKKVGRSFQIPSSDILSNFQQEFWKWYEVICHELDGVCIIGGEPMASPNFFNVLEKLVEVNERNKSKIKKVPYLSLTSNFNARKEVFDRFLKTLDVVKNHFKLSVNASIESIEDKAEFIRDNLDWKKFENNISNFLIYTKEFNKDPKNHTLVFSLHSAQNIFSIMYLKEFLIWADALEAQFDVPINLIQNIVYYPQMFSIQHVAPKDFKKHLGEGIEYIKSREVRKNIYYISNSSWEQYQLFLESISSGLDQRSPDIDAVLGLKRWFEGLEDQKKIIFKKYFSEILKH